MPRDDGTLMVEDATIMFRNFEGKAGTYNQAGDRNFCLFLDEDTAEELMKDGWKVKHLRVREEGDTPQAYIEVKVSYRDRKGNRVRPPTVVLITSRGRQNLDEDQCELLDWVEIANVDLIVRPYQWSMNGETGIKAYLKSIYVTVREDDLMRKYADVPELGPEENLELERGDENVIDAEVVDEWDSDDRKALGR